MCCKKKLLELSYIFIPRSFLVINVCIQGKTLCSPCIIIWLIACVSRSLEKSTIILKCLKWNNVTYRLFHFVRVVKSRRMRWAGHVARMGEGRGVYRVLVGKPEGKRPLGRPSRRWEDNIKMDLQEVGGGCGDWMELAQDRDRWRTLVSTVMNLRVPKLRGISWLAAEPVSFSRRTLLHGVSK